MNISIPRVAPIQALSWEQGRKIIEMLTPSKEGIIGWQFTCRPERPE